MLMFRRETYDREIERLKLRARRRGGERDRLCVAKEGVSQTKVDKSRFRRTNKTLNYPRATHQLL